MKNGLVDPTSNELLRKKLKTEPRSPGIKHIPPEIVGKIHSYMDRRDYDPMLYCNLALVCKSFLEYFTTKSVWDDTDYIKGYNFRLLQHSVENNIWESDSINDWYRNNDCLNTLPPDIWNHRALLEVVLERLDVVCAPSKKDFEPYADDPLMAALFIDRMPDGDCFSCLSTNLRANKKLVLQAIEKFPKVIKFCTPELLNDRDFIKEVVEANGKCLEYLGDYCEDTELLISASRTDVNVLKYAKGEASEDLQRIYSWIRENKKQATKK